MLFYHRVEPRTGYRGTLYIEGLRLHSHKQTSSQRLAPWPVFPVGLAQALKDPDFWLILGV